MTLSLVEDLVYYAMTKFGGQLRLGVELEGDIGNIHTKNLLRHLKLSTEDLPYKSHPVSMKNYSKEFKRLREDTSSVLLIVTPAMVKI